MCLLSSPEVQPATATSLVAPTARTLSASLALDTSCASSSPIADPPLAAAFPSTPQQHRYSLTQYTDEIFLMYTPPCDNRCPVLVAPLLPEDLAPSHADCSSQCSLPVQPTDRVTQCNPLLSRFTTCRDPSCAEHRNLTTNLKTTIQVLDGELISFRNEKKKEDSDWYTSKEDWVVV
ncbi:hypothetical protein J6590_093369 [Homalodisca vitripennis]|nr:hypothetical protein J6590_093369 [Homalodisca vitripennis]